MWWLSHRAAGRCDQPQRGSQRNISTRSRRAEPPQEIVILPPLWNKEEALFDGTSKMSGVRATSAALSLVPQCCCSCLQLNRHADIGRVRVTAQTSRFSCQIRTLASVHLRSCNDQSAVATSFTRDKLLLSTLAIPSQFPPQHRAKCFVFLRQV